MIPKKTVKDFPFVKNEGKVIVQILDEDLTNKASFKFLN
jgi:hypothetical protein